MAEPLTSQELAGDLYNQLIALPFEEQERIGKIEWNLRGLREKEPGCLPVSVAHLLATIMSGQPDIARDLAEFNWSHRTAAESEVAWTFATQLIDLGQFQRARELDLLRWLSLGQQSPSATGDRRA